MAKKKTSKKQSKIYIDKIIKRFYKVLKYDYSKTGEPEVLEDYPEGDIWGNPNIEYEYEPDSCDMVGCDFIDLKMLLPACSELNLESLFNEYEKVRFVVDNEGDYMSRPRIEGRRLETDEEFDARMKALENVAKEREKAKAKKKQQVLDRKKKLLEKLQKELEVE